MTKFVRPLSAVSMVHRAVLHRRAMVGLRGSSLGSLALSALLVPFFAGCSLMPRDFAREPELSPVGSGIRPPAVADRGSVERDRIGDRGLKDDGWAPAGPGAPRFAGRRLLRESEAVQETGSLWRDQGADLFRDRRARRPGDILMVTIKMKDKASLDNSSKRSRDAASGIGFDWSHAIALPWLASEGTASANGTVNANTSTDGKGEIARSESIDLRIAAVVTGVLPNGNLVIEGSQEMRVNYELRVLTFSGIVNIADIGADNTISYDRIAEARMSYGGRGRIMEVQQPGWMQQLNDHFSPY